jgi:uncharacterized protein YbjT (DUF2867 family)
MILLTGATGRIGGVALSALVQAGESVRVLARNPARLADAGPLVEAVAGDLDDPATLTPAMEGADRMLMLAPGPDIAAQDAAMIAAAQQAGLRQVVMVSSLGAELGGIAGGGPHLPGEALLKESGLGWTILHPTEFMTNTIWWAETIRPTGSVFLPTGTGRVGFIDPADIGEVAAAVLTGDGHNGQIYRLTGPEALTTADVAALIGQSRGEPVTHVDVTPEAMAEGMTQAGMPPPLIDMMVTYYGAVKEGRVDVVTDDVPRLLGRPARSFAHWLAGNAAVFST